MFYSTVYCNATCGTHRACNTVKAHGMGFLNMSFNLIYQKISFEIICISRHVTSKLNDDMDDITLQKGVLR